MDNNQILTYLVESGIINPLEIQAEMEMRRNDKFLQMHNYKIWQTKNGDWMTYLPDEKKGRVQKRRKTEKEIKDLVIAYYRGIEENPTVNRLFKEWLDRRIKNGEIEEATYTRYDADYKRCFTGKKLDHMHVKSVTYIDIEDFIKECIREKKMSRKAYSNLRTLVYGIFRYAKKKQLIDWNIRDVIEQIDFSKKEFVRVKHDDSELVFSESEENKLLSLMKSDLSLLNLGLLLVFKTGMRIGELSALKPSDIHENRIHVQRTETSYRDRDTGKRICTVKDTTKTDAGDRLVIVPDDALWILKRIQIQCSSSEWLFYRDGRRITERCFRNKLYRLCKNAGVVKKSPHKIRKTYGTKLLDARVPDSLIMEMMGHTNINVAKKHYYVNRYNDSEKSDMINAAGI